MRQELEGALLSEYKDALWKRAQLAAITKTPPERAHFVRMVIGVDPAVGGKDETGIIVAGRTKSGCIWILEDASLSAQPAIWVRQIARMAERYRAEAVAAELLDSKWADQVGKRAVHMAALLRGD